METQMENWQNNYLSHCFKAQFAANDEDIIICKQITSNVTHKLSILPLLLEFSYRSKQFVWRYLTVCWDLIYAKNEV